MQKRRHPALLLIGANGRLAAIGNHAGDAVDAIGGGISEIAAPGIADDGDLARALDCLDRGLDIGQRLLGRDLPAHLLAFREPRLIIAKACARFHPIEQRWRDCDIALGCKAICDLAQMRIDAGLVLQDDDSTLGRVGGIGPVGGETVSVACRQFDHGSLHSKDCWMGARYSRPSSSRTSSDIRDLSQGGSKTSRTSAFVTPSTSSTAFCTQLTISPATGQPGAVNVMSISTRPAAFGSIR